MEISIDGCVLDVTLEHERTVGELFLSLETWLSGTGFRPAAFELNGRKISAGDVADAFATGLDKVTRLAIKTTSVAQLYTDALTEAAFFLETRDGAAAKEAIGKEWAHSSGRSFLKEACALFAGKLDDYILRGEGDGKKLDAQIAERFHETGHPQEALLALKERVYDITSRLENLALAMQMGKDKEATETIYAFSEITGKIFRIISFAPAAVRESGDDDFFEEFTGILKEFSAAYEAQDSVLAGDLAEYEVAPRLIELYNRLEKRHGLQPVEKTAAKAG